MMYKYIHRLLNIAHSLSLLIQSKFKKSTIFLNFNRLNDPKTINLIKDLTLFIVKMKKILEIIQHIMMKI